MVELLHKNLLDLLVCPLCQSPLQLEVLSAKGKDGVLRCSSGHWYPIINGLPKILVGKLRSDHDFFEEYGNRLVSSHLVLEDESEDRQDSKQVQEIFGEKWTSKDTMGITDSSPYKRFMRRWMLEKYGWLHETGFSNALAGRRLILDAGTGLGREVINLAKAARTSIVIGIELSDCAMNALRNVSSFKNACIIQGDILKMPFKESTFDFILSEGVLHHTPDTRRAFAECCRVLKQHGEIAFYVYRKKGPLREFADDYVREIMQSLSSDQKWKISEKITRLGHALSDLRTQVRIPDDIPELGMKKGDMDVQRFIYSNFMKCFWNDELPFDENVMVNFDWYAPKHAHRHTESEIRQWCRENSLEITWFHEEESGYSVRAVKQC